MVDSVIFDTINITLKTLNKLTPSQIFQLAFFDGPHTLNSTYRSPPIHWIYHWLVGYTCKWIIYTWNAPSPAPFPDMVPVFVKTSWNVTSFYKVLVEVIEQLTHWLRKPVGTVWILTLLLFKPQSNPVSQFPHLQNGDSNST